MVDDGGAVGARQGANGFRVFALRDPRDGEVFLVGRGKDTGVLGSGQGIGSNDEAARARIRAIRDDGLQVEEVMLADGLVNETAAATVERAVLSAYQAARLSPSPLVGAMGRGPGAGAFNDPPQSRDAFDDPDVRRFVASAATEIDQLSLSLSQAERELAAASAGGFLDSEHRHRLDELVLRQDEEISELNAALDRVRALRDLAVWAARTVGGAQTDPTIRLSDLIRALG